MEGRVEAQGKRKMQQKSAGTRVGFLSPLSLVPKAAEEDKVQKREVAERDTGKRRDQKGSRVN